MDVMDHKVKRKSWLYQHQREPSRVEENQPEMCLRERHRPGLTALHGTEWEAGPWSLSSGPTSEMRIMACIFDRALPSAPRCA